MSGTKLTLTTAHPFEAGSAFLDKPFNSRYLRITFTVTLSGGTGGDGVTVALADSAGAEMLGANGGGLGFFGIGGMAVAFGTDPNGSIAATNYVALAQSAPPGSSAALTFSHTTTRLPPLRNGPDVVQVVVHDQDLSVRVDDVPCINTRVLLPESVFVGFTAGTGALDDIHAVDDIKISDVYLPPSAPGAPVTEDGLVEQP